MKRIHPIYVSGFVTYEDENETVIALEPDLMIDPMLSTGFMFSNQSLL